MHNYCYYFYQVAPLLCNCTALTHNTFTIFNNPVAKSVSFIPCRFTSKGHYCCENPGDGEGGGGGRGEGREEGPLLSLPFPAILK